jgi:hypothetical protein
VILFPKAASSTRINPDIAEIIEITTMCKAFSSLPLAGGVLDQPAELIVKMQLVMIAQSEKAESDIKDKTKSGPRHPRT